jgi:peptidoglycan/xylan/chitin deacetylase (PgdA/CDA1 family)
MEKLIAWPGGVQAAAMISIELDAELIWLELDPTNIDRPKTLSMGTYGMQRGIYRMLSALEERKMTATFFVPGRIAETYPDIIRLVAQKGHEIALHGYEHENFGLLTAEEQRAAIKKGIDSLTALTGKRPSGFRLPEGNMTPDTLSLIAEQGFLYDSSMVDSDVPYRITGLPQGLSLIEIPMCWELQDFTYFAFNFVPPFPEGESRIASYKSVLDIWLRELEAYYEYGLCYVIKFDPQTSGGPGRITMFERVLDEIQKRNIWLATGAEIASYIENPPVS